MTDTEYRVLGIINNSPEITQREISVQVDISLGKTNNLINSLIDNELITTKKLGRGAVYSLTGKGIQALEKELKSRFKVRINLHETEYKKVKQAVILAKDNIKEFDKPIGFLSIEDEDTTIISRIIKILRKNDIENIIIVAGYKSECYDELKRKENITVVENTSYRFTGSMASLSLAKDYIKDDLIIIDGNIIFEEMAITEILSSKVRDCMFVAPESDSGNEVFVKIQDDRIIKINRDIRALESVDGELVGITKLSFAMYLRMLKEYEDNQNAYYSYKSQVFNLSMNYRIGCVKFEDLEWYKVYNNSHYKRVLNMIYPRIKGKELSLEIEDIKKIIVDGLNVNANDIKYIMPISRLTNKVYRFCINETTYVLRIPFSEAAEVFDREQEDINSRFATSMGINVNMRYFNKSTGIKISEAILNAKYLKPAMAKKTKSMLVVAELLRRLHNSNIEMVNEFNAFNLMDYYERLTINNDGKFYDGYNMIKHYVFKLKVRYQNYNVKLVHCHNAAIPENFIESNLNKVYLIDWEFSGLNDPLWDITSFCLASDFNEDEEEHFLDIYFCGNVEDGYRERLIMNKIFHDFLWSIWISFKEATGSNFGTLGHDCFARAKNNLNIIFNGEIVK